MQRSRRPPSRSRVPSPCRPRPPRGLLLILWSIPVLGAAPGGADAAGLPRDFPVAGGPLPVRATAQRPMAPFDDAPSPGAAVFARHCQTAARDGGIGGIGRWGGPASRRRDPPALGVFAHRGLGFPSADRYPGPGGEAATWLRRGGNRSARPPHVAAPPPPPPAFRESSGERRRSGQNLDAVRLSYANPLSWIRAIALDAYAVWKGPIVGGTVGILHGLERIGQGALQGNHRYAVQGLLEMATAPLRYGNYGGPSWAEGALFGGGTPANWLDGDGYRVHDAHWGRGNQSDLEANIALRKVAWSRHDLGPYGQLHRVLSTALFGFQDALIGATR